MKAMILAAGRGERMGKLTIGTPKPLLQLGPETLIGRHLKRLAEAGVSEVVINLSHQGELIRDHLVSSRRWGLRITYSHEGEPSLDTGGGIICALPLLGNDPFLLVSADVLTDIDFSSLTFSTGKGLLVLVPNPPHHPAGDFGLTSDGQLTVTPPRLTYAGIALLDPELFRNFKPKRQPLRPIFDSAIEQGLLTGLRYDGLWLDVGTPERLEDAREVIQQREKKNL